MSLSQAVQEAIRANLPGQAAEEMKNFITQAQQTESRLASVTADRDNLRKQLDEKTAILASHQDLAVNKARDAEIELIKRAAAIDTQIARAELAGVKDTMGLFLRNVTVRTSVQEQVGVPVQGSPAGNGYGGSCGMVLRSDDKRETTETKE
jgi:hypothetical protein